MIPIHVCGRGGSAVAPPTPRTRALNDRCLPHSVNRVPSHFPGRPLTSVTLAACLTIAGAAEPAAATALDHSASSVKATATHASSHHKKKSKKKKHHDPATLAKLGTPKKITESNGSTALVTLNGVRYAPMPGDNVGLSQLVVASFTLKNTSSKPFSYEDEAIVAEYGTTPSTTANPNSWGSDPIADYTPFGDPLRNGALAPGESKTGLTIYELSKDADLTLQFDDPTTPGWKLAAFWRLKTAK